MQMTNQFICTVAIAVAMITPKCNSGTGQSGEFTTGWDSGELQTQIGNENGIKRKLVMKVWHTYQQKSNGSYEWFVLYSMKAEDHNQSGNGWHQVKKLSAFTFKAVVELPNGVMTINKSENLVDVSSPHERVVLAHYNTIGLPFFKSKTATGSRFGGPSGISITWP